LGVQVVSKLDCQMKVKGIQNPGKSEQKLVKGFRFHLQTKPTQL